MVTLSESVKKNRVERPLAEKLWWRHIRLAIKHLYLGNHASQTKSYNGTLSGSHGRSSRIRYKNSPEAPPCGGLTMTSCPVGKKTSLSRKPCIADTKLLWITIMKSWSQSNVYKKQQILILKTYQFINVVNGGSRSHKTANIFFSFDSVA